MLLPERCSSHLASRTRGILAPPRFPGGQAQVTSRPAVVPSASSATSAPSGFDFEVCFSQRLGVSAVNIVFDAPPSQPAGYKTLPNARNLSAAERISQGGQAQVTSRTRKRDPPRSLPPQCSPALILTLSSLRLGVSSVNIVLTLLRPKAARDTRTLQNARNLRVPRELPDGQSWERRGP